MTIVINDGTWENFEQTGSIEAYLNYINTYKNVTDIGSDNLVKPEENYGNGVILDEDQRLR